MEEAAKAFAMEHKKFEGLVQEWNKLAFDPNKQAEADAKEEELKRQADKLEAAAKKRALEALAELKRQQQEALKKWREAEAIRQAEEAARLQAIQDAQAREEARRKAVELEEKRQQQLQQIGQCSAGFRWINRGNGTYQCAGGSHWHQF